MLSVFRLCLLLATGVALNGCADPPPATKVVGTVKSPDGKQALTLFAVVPGSILDNYLAVNISEPGAPYSEAQTVASFSDATELRAFWTQTGQPVITAGAMTGTTFPLGKDCGLVVCQGASARSVRRTTLAWQCRNTRTISANFRNGSTSDVRADCLQWVEGGHDRY